MTMRAASAMAPVGKSSGAGRPPPNEMTSGCWVTFSISRIVEARRCAVRSANFAAREIVVIGLHLTGGHWGSAYGSARGGRPVVRRDRDRVGRKREYRRA